MNKKFLQLAVMLMVLFSGFNTYAANINVTTDITANTNWTNNNIYILYGDIIVKNGATLTIQEGTIVKGDKSTLSRLVVATGAKLVAQGTPEQPIVFTSNQAAGARARGDWAGLAICGLAPVNFKDGSGNSIQGRIECGTTTDYDFGGNIPNDSSGVLSYVRIEYAGYVCGSNSELNSLTMGGVGNRTKIDHVMVTYGQDDGFEWFGGTVNANHIVSFGSRDDDFDTDNGYSGKVQHGLVIRVDTIADQGDISNAFESDNDANGTYNGPYTQAVFSNITVIGPAATTASVIDAKYGWALRLRRNTGLNIFNSLFIGYKRGLRIEGTGSQTKATTDTLEFKNNIIAGSKEQYYETAFDSLYLLAQPSNTIIRGNANDTVGLVYPYGNPDLYNFLPTANSPALAGASFANPKLSGLTNTTYRGAFGADNWATCWAEFSPQDENYSTGPVNYAFTAQVTNAGPLTFCEGGNVTLNASSSVSGVSYLWSNGATTASITPTTSGTYTVTVTTARGCVRTDSKVVVVNPSPAVPAVTASSNAFCTGASGVTLTSTSATSYLWSNGATTSSVTVNFGGTYSVTVSDANQCTAASISVAITQHTPTVPVIAASGSTTFCTGGSVDVAVNNAGNYSAFTWSDASTTSAITVNATGAYTVTTTDNNGCTAVSNVINTNVSNAPAPTVSAGSATTFCDGGTVTLSSTQADTYLWSNGATTQTITVTASGNFTVTVTNSNACYGTGASNTVNVTVAAQPEAVFTSAVTGFAYTYEFTNNSTDATTYNWNFGDGNSSTATSPTHAYAANGTYTVTLTATNGNCSDVSTTTVTIIGVSVDEAITALDRIVLFPNPNTGAATLQVSANNSTDALITITDMTGRQIYVLQSEMASGVNHIAINTSEFANGLYLVTVNSGNENKVVRMVVNK